MHISFVDVTAWNYTIETAYQAPLGGSHSALCYLAEQLALLGHDVRLFNRTAGVSILRGVICAPLERISEAAWKELDVVIVQNWAKIGRELRGKLRPDAKLVLWTQHAHDQPAIAALAQPEFRDAHDAFVFVSDWQREQYVRAFRIADERSHVLRNAIGPSFERMFDPTESILKQKSQPPILAYTSTPFRGLDVLLDAFPAIRDAVPDVRLRVYSSMQVYQVSQERDALQYGLLYDKCRSTPGVEYVGSLTQRELAKELAKVTLLAYPNTFPETSCIAVMEAMASGCHVVTSNLGALSETMSGFGTLVDFDSDRISNSERFSTTVVCALQRVAMSSSAIDAQLGRQLAHMNDTCTWRVRAWEWQRWLASL